MTDRRKIKRAVRKFEKAWKASGAPVVLDHPRYGIIVSFNKGVTWEIATKPPATS